MKWEVLYTLSNSAADSNMMAVPRKSTGATDCELNWQCFSWNIIFLLEIMFYKLWLFGLRYLAAIHKKEPTISKVSLSLQWKQTTLFVANDKI